VPGLKNKWAIALAAGAFTTTLVGGVAMAGFQPFSAQERGIVGGPATGLVERDQPVNKIKAALDTLVTKGTITQAQEDAILQALKDTTPPARPKAPVGPIAPNIRSFIGDMTRVATTYLGLSEKDLAVRLRAGKSIADVATSLSKSTAELTTLLTNSANEKIDKAVAANRLTADQAVTLKSRIAAEVTSFVQRSFTKPAPRPLAPLKPSPSPTP
jgi:polyhydroxyalkanoate synthesis regulator phasin